MRRLGGIAAVLGLVVGACATSTVATTTTAAPTTTAGVEHPPAVIVVPTSWVGARSGDAGYEILLVADEGDALLTTTEATPSDGDPAVPVDIHLDEPNGQALIAFCCGPASGSVQAVPLDGSGTAETADHGHRFDLAGTTFARVDAVSGSLGIRPAFPSSAGEWIDEGAGALAVAVAPDGGRVYVLTATEVVGYEIGAAGPVEVARWPVPEAAYCDLIALGRGAVGLRRDEGPADPTSLDCIGAVIDVLGGGDGEPIDEVVDFGVPIRHVGVDETGELMIATSVNGAVFSMVRGGHSIPLAEDGSGYLVADW